MGSLKKAVFFASKYSMLIKMLIALLWVLWAGQFSGPLGDFWKAEQEYNCINYHQKAMLNQEYVDIVEKIIADAKILDAKYSPSHYFGDMRTIDEKRKEPEKKYKARVMFVDTSFIHTLALNNIRSGRFTTEQTLREGGIYRDWKMGAEGGREETIDKIKKAGWTGFGKWFLILLVRGMLLACSLYLVRMCERKGVVQTIHEGKRAFVRSIILWPIYIWQYPFNIIHEIRIEAEFRRLGNAFRKLTVAEIATIRTAASSGRYEEWINHFRMVNHHRFRRSLLIALIPAILLYAFPVFAFGNTETALKCTSVQSVQLEHQHNKAPPDLPLMDVTPIFCSEGPLLPMRQKLFEQKKLVPQGVRREIDHVPLHFVVCES